MKYVIYKLDWSSGEGLGPENTALESNATIKGAFLNGDAETGFFLGYLTGEIPVENFAAWSLVEVSVQDALEFVKELDPDADLLPNGEILFPFRNIEPFDPSNE